MSSASYILGLGFGPPQDFTVLAVVEKSWPLQTDAEPHYGVRELQRFPLGTPYPEIVASAWRRGSKLSQTNPTAIVADQTGVGRPVVDLLQKHGRVSAVTITAGSGQSFDEGNHTWRVAKMHLAGLLQVLLQTRRLHIARSLPEAEALTRELLNFKVKVRPELNESFDSWREQERDDLVLAIALACWGGERFAPGPMLEPMVFPNRSR
jgi:hypothetical protein